MPRTPPLGNVDSFCKLFGVAMLVGFGEKRYRKNLPLADATHLNGQCHLCESPSGNNTICPVCADEYGQRHPLSAEFWTELDRDIFANRKLAGMKFIAGILDGGLKSAIRIYAARYDILREAFPDSFTQSHDKYWSGFSS